MNKKKKPIKKTPYDIRQNTAYFVRNRLPAFILAGMIIFWTIASIFGLIGYCRSKPKNTAMITANADSMPIDNEYVCDIEFFQGLVMYDPAEYYCFKEFVELRFEGNNESPSLNVNHYDYFNGDFVPLSCFYLNTNADDICYFEFNVIGSTFDSHYLYDSIYHEIRYFFGPAGSVFDFTFYFTDESEDIVHTTRFELIYDSPLQNWFSADFYNYWQYDDNDLLLVRRYSMVPYGQFLYYYEEYLAHIGDYDKGYKEGYNNGLKAPNQSQFNEGYEIGKEAGYNNGYARGKADGLALADVATFDDLMSSVFDIPVRTFTNLFSFDVLGVNLANFFLSILTLCVVLAVVKMLI